MLMDKSGLRSKKKGERAPNAKEPQLIISPSTEEIQSIWANQWKPKTQ